MPNISRYPIRFQSSISEAQAHRLALVMQHFGMTRPAALRYVLDRGLDALGILSGDATIPDTIERPFKKTLDASTDRPTDEQ